MNGNNSGWIIVKNSQVGDGATDHCHMRSPGDCVGSQNVLDSNGNNGTANWSKDANPQWLTNFTTKRIATPFDDACLMHDASCSPGRH
ncbi:hypothetical protein [Massilia luteola]|uniref:hypothetical protein n=1 Tax=Massilia luteola TaxID=3081751 RepID=UPI002ACBF5AC|nr:hypothetical protein [Massilia sp. Gc5]